MATEPKWYAIIDGAQDPRLVDLVQQCSERSCLFKGESARSLAGVAPWLVRIATDEALLATWQEHGRGRNWGVMLLSSLSLAELQRHFRKFLQAKLPDGTIAGSAASLLTGVRFLTKAAGRSLVEATRMAAFNPARLMRVEHRLGSLEIGKEATFLRLSPQTLALKEIWVQGQLV